MTCTLQQCGTKSIEYGVNDRPLVAEISHSNPPIVGVASVRFSPIAATQVIIFNLF